MALPYVPDTFAMSSMYTPDVLLTNPPPDPAVTLIVRPDLFKPLLTE